MQSRIRERRESFEKLPPRDRELIQHKQIREGMSPDAVYIAWGKPDEITRGVRAGQPFETWLYFIATQQQVPQYRVVSRIDGRRSVLDSIYDSAYVTNWFPDRAVIFQNGRVVSWQIIGLP